MEINDVKRDIARKPDKPLRNKNPAPHLFRVAGFLAERRSFRFHFSFELEEQDFFRNTDWFYPELVLFSFISRNRFKKSKEMAVVWDQGSVVGSRVHGQGCPESDLLN